MKDNIEEKYEPYIDLTDEGEYQIRIKCVSREDAYKKLQALTTRKEAFEEALAMLPPLKEIDEIDYYSIPPLEREFATGQEHGHNTAVALMRERLLGKIK